MARVASCPQCEHDLLVPENAEPSALVKCPQCRAFFELQHAESHELPAALVVTSHPEPSAPENKLSKTPTLDDFSSRATLVGDAEPISEEELKAEADIAETIDFGVEESAGHGSISLPSTRIIGEPQDFKPAGSESHEEAAQRIDQWFRSAKTLSDVPPLPDDLSGESSHEMVEPVAHAIGNEPIGDSHDELAFDEHDADLELDAGSDSPSDAAPWDDSQHMDRLLSDLEGQPVDTFEPTDHEEFASSDDQHEDLQPADDWTPDDSLAIPETAGKPERKSSIVRTLAVSVFGGLIGLGLGYYALLWMGPVLHRGKEIDFLQVAQYLPKVMLPSTFQTKVKSAPAVAPSKMVDDLAASEKAAKSDENEKLAKSEPTNTAATEPVAPPAPANLETKTPASPPEKQAVYTTPAEPAKKPADTDDRYAIPPAKDEPKMREPASLDAPPAKAITETAPKVEPVRIKNAPSFTTADVSAALTAATAAEAGLVTGNLQDGKDVARTKGASYMAIANFAEKATFADAADSAKSQQEADEFFHKLLSNTHTRDEVAQIVPRWLSHPKRPQNGVFLAGSVKHVDIPGSVIEYTVELKGGPEVVVVVPVTDNSESVGGPKGPIAVAGSIIDKPAEEIPGYKGKAPQVVFAKKLLPLE